MQEDITVYDQQDLLTILNKITLANNSIFNFPWEFEVVNGGDKELRSRGWLVNIAFERPDIYTGVVGKGRGRWEFIARGASESSVVKTAWLLFELLIRHELMEAFNYREKRIFNPHNSVHALGSIQS